MIVSQNPSNLKYINGYNDLKTYVLYNLGWPTIRVELTEEQIITCIIEAITYFSKYSGEIYYKIITTSSNGDNAVDIPDDPDDPDYVAPLQPGDPGYDPFNTQTGKPRRKIMKGSIIDVVFPSSSLDSLGEAFLTGGLAGGLDDYILPMMSSNMMDNPIMNIDLMTYYLYCQKIDDFKKIVGIDRMWEILNDKIYLYPASNDWSGSIGIIYKPSITEDDAQQEQWIKEYSLAKAKIILGTIRSKLSGYNSAGVNISADGEALKTEGREDITNLKEELKAKQPPLPFLQA